jgi:hypothetical protein
VTLLFGANHLKPVPASDRPIPALTAISGTYPAHACASRIGTGEVELFVTYKEQAGITHVAQVHRLRLQRVLHSRASAFAAARLALFSPRMII